MTKSDGKSNKNQNGEYKGNDTVNDLGMTDAEFAAMFDSMTPEEREAFIISLGEGDQANDTKESGYYNSDYAQQVFALVNQERANNGLTALTWDSSMASYSDRRAMEITTDFSHNSAGGKMNVGENIAKGAISPDMVMDGWMRSDGHRANILNANYTKISVSCYYDGSTYYWVQNFAY